MPSDPAAALPIRMLDRFFDNYVMTPVQEVVLDALRAPGQHDPTGVAEARAMRGTAYAWLEGALADRQWAAGEAFSLADCAAAPAFCHAD